MEELRKNPATGQWVLVRPETVPVGHPTECPFCPGNESATPPEIAAFRKEGAPPNGPGWSVRVVPERDPFFRVERDLVRMGVGMYDTVTPRGASEIVIESPGHDDTLVTMSDEQVERVLWMYRDRLSDLHRDVKIRDVLITRRYKKPGVRITHPYSRVIASPIVFDALRRELVAAREYFRYKRRCVFCDIVREEIAAEERVVRMTQHFLVVVPYTARHAGETWILPRQHHCAYESVKSPVVTDLAHVLRACLGALKAAFEDPSYELTVYTAPNLTAKILQDDWTTIHDDFHWHIEIVPRPERANRVGGIFVTEAFPEMTSRELKNVWV
jgi:UDPglucose--hexose-1-phosphate uridylyltransferase